MRQRCYIKERRLGALDGQEQKFLWYSQREGDGQEKKFLWYCQIEGRNPGEEDVSYTLQWFTHRGGRAPFSGSRTLGLNLRGRRRKLKQEYDFKILCKRTTFRSARWSGAEAFMRHFRRRA